MTIEEIARGMPVGDKISWHNERFPMVLFSRARCERNHYQTPEQLAERGGLSWREAAAIITDKAVRETETAGAEQTVRAALRTHLQSRQP